MGKFFRKIKLFVLFNIWWFLVRPYRKLVNYYIHGYYVEDNERNWQIIEYCQKIIRDADYEPSTPVEHWVDADWQRSSRELYDRKRAEGVIGEDEPYNYQVARPFIARQVFKEMAEVLMKKAA